MPFSPCAKITKGGVGSSSNSDNVDSPAGTTATESVGSGSGDEDAVVVDDMYVEAEDIIDVYVEAEDDDDESAGGAGGGGGKGGGVGSGGFFVKKKAKKGNKMCSWSWREKSCQPAALCQYKYQASSYVQVYNTLYAYCRYLRYTWYDGIRSTRYIFSLFFIIYFLFS